MPFPGSRYFAIATALLAVLVSPCGLPGADGQTNDPTPAIKAQSGSQTQQVVCSGGFGRFDAESTTGLTVSVGAARNGEFAARACQAKLSWDKQDLLVEPVAWKIDVDAMDVDLGLGSRVVALQVKTTEVDPLMKYEIYSLQKPPQQLRVITGGDFYSAADTDLDGRIEIWTDDAGAVNGFENLETHPESPPREGCSNQSDGFPKKNWGVREKVLTPTCIYAIT
jgi:hypothetical protein